MGIETRQIKAPAEIKADYPEFGFDMVKQQLQLIQPEPVRAAAQAYYALTQALATASSDLITHAKRLSEIWGGAAATKHLEQFQKLHWTVVTLHDSSSKVYRNYDWLGNVILPYYRNMGIVMANSWTNAITGSYDMAAKLLLWRYVDRLVEGHNALPDSIRRDLPQHGSASGYGPSGRPKVGSKSAAKPKMPGTSNTSNTSKTPSTPNGLGSSPNVPSIPPGPGGSPYGPGLGGPGGLNPGGGSLPVPGGLHGGSNLAGGPLPGAGGLGPGGLGAGGAGGLGAGGLGAGGLGAGGLGGGLNAGGLGGAPGVMPGVMPGGLAGGVGAAATQESALARAAGRTGTGGMVGGMPMGAGAGHGGSDQQERERTTWLTEDEDVWGADGDAVPPVIG